MHVALVLPESELTEYEKRLVDGIVRIPIVRQLTILVHPRQRSFVETVGSYLAHVERAIGRLRLNAVEATQLANDKVVVRHLAASSVCGVLVSMKADKVLLLSGATPDAASSSASDILQLWWDGQQPEGLGANCALRPPPCEVVVSIRHKSQRDLQLVHRSILTCTRGAAPTDRRNAIARSLALVLRAIRTGNAGSSPVHKVDPRSYSFTDILRALWAISTILLYMSGLRVAGFMWRQNAWYLAYSANPQTSTVPISALEHAEFHKYISSYDRFFADPIAIKCDGLEAVFFEEFHFALGRGVISCALVGSDGTLGAPQRVLERPYHLSYPFVFDFNGAVYMIPETAANRTVELYRCIKFPCDWILEATLFRDITATDATVHFDGETWWMFATVGEEGSYTWDELFIFMAQSPLGPWRPHSTNPVKCDSRSSRPAGPLFFRGKKLMRPTQDCSRAYGQAVNLCEVEVLNSSEFREVVVGRISAELFPGADGLHSVTFSDRLVVVDVRPKWRFRWKAASRR